MSQVSGRCFISRSLQGQFFCIHLYRNHQFRGGTEMSATETEKILAHGCGKEHVHPGEIIDVKVDRVMLHDPGMGIIEKFLEIEDAKLWDPDRISIFIDHHTPSTSIKWANEHAKLRKFANDYGITHFFDCGRGISHVVTIEEGLASAGEIVAGGDSHTTGEGATGAFATGVGATEMATVLATGRLWLKVPETIKVFLDGKRPENVYPRDIIAAIMGRIGAGGANYRAIEFHGPAADALTIEERIGFCVQSVDIGAKNALFVSSGDSDAQFIREEYIDVSKLEPLVALPSMPTNVVTVSEAEQKKVMINEGFIGSCAGGLLGEIATAARVIEGKHVASGVRLLVIPASSKIFNEALEKGYIKTLHDAGAVIGSPACGACGGHDVGILAEGETCISNSTRNFVGRMGPGGTIYLASAATIAASAVKGYISGEKGSC
jgi:3-isopropylmalate dehydratase large subunit